MKAVLTLLVGVGLVLCSYGDSTKDTQTTTGERLLTRAYKVDVQAFLQNLERLSPPKPGESERDLLLRFFKENRVEIAKEGAVLLDAKAGRLWVRATQTSQEAIEILVQRIVNNQAAKPDDRSEAKAVVPKDAPAAAEKAEKLMLRGKYQFEKGLFDSAQGTLEKAVQLDPWNQEAWYFLHRVQDSIDERERTEQRRRDFLRRWESI
jgi:tetratricopeptide (TPR) repeat protein